MTSSEAFYGPWTLSVVSRDASYDQRVVITGSDAMDGVYPGAATAPPVAITGARWQLAMEWNDNAASGWQPSDMRRSARYTADEGLVVEIGADDNLVALRDGDYNDVIISLVSTDSKHTPLHPITHPYDFTLSPEVLKANDHYPRAPREPVPPKEPLPPKEPVKPRDPRLR